MNTNLLWLIPILPFTGFLINGTLGRKLPRAAVSAIALLFTLVPALIVAKLWTIAVPYAFKWATDAVAAEAHGKIGTHALFGLLLGPLALTVLYGLGRVLMQLTTQGRDALFAAVAMHAVRRLAQEVFVHLHQLSLRFHLERKTGGLTRVLERGRNAIETIVRVIMLTAVPTVIEFALILVVLFFQFDIAYVGAVAGMIAIYLVWTFVATNWRMSILFYIY